MLALPENSHTAEVVVVNDVEDNEPRRKTPKNGRIISRVLTTHPMGVYNFKHGVMAYSGLARRGPKG